ncbi:MAG TPA: ATP-binding protein, partial [Candidatus Paceibacterota bacterium]|nr:ATP-binding protein [Candidatus Paceibacterota bacterium]
MSDDWNIEKLNSLISSKIEESFSLEYKGAGAFSETDKKKRNVRTEITKDISAMANSSGGKIIYGMAEYSDDARRHLPERIDPITRSQFSKEWLESVISNIKPRIELLKIVPIEVPTNSDHAVYVVEIPKSTTAHQALDFRYYRRYNFESVPMHDYEIRDVMNRQRFPTLSVSASLQFDRFGVKGTLHFEIQNTSDVLAKHFLAIIHVPVPLKWQSKVIIFSDGILDKLEDGSALRLNLTNDNGAPLFPKSGRYINFEFGTGTMHPEPK